MSEDQKEAFIPRVDPPRLGAMGVKAGVFENPGRTLPILWFVHRTVLGEVTDETEVHFSAAGVLGTDLIDLIVGVMHSKMPGRDVTEAELALLRRQRDEVLLLCEDSDESEFYETRGDLRTESIRAVFDVAGTPRGEPLP